MTIWSTEDSTTGHGRELKEWIIVTPEQMAYCEKDHELYIDQRQVIDLEAISEIIEAFLISISIVNNYDLVPSFDEALRELVNVVYHAFHIWVEKVRHHVYIMGTGSTGGKICRASWGEGT